MPPVAAIGAAVGGAAGAGLFGATAATAVGGTLSGALLGAGVGSYFSPGPDYDGMYERQDAAFREADAIMAQAYQEAAAASASGAHAAADAIMAAAKQASGTIMRESGLAIGAMEKYYALADQKLEPFRQAGLAAGNEMSSMLGIPNADGEIVPYDLDKLRATPGYNFLFEEGSKAIDKSAVGTKLSGAQAKAAQQYGQGLADTYFQTQFNNLNEMYKTGYGAAANQAQHAMTQGGRLGELYLNRGNQLANLQMGAGQAIAGAHSAAGNARANMLTALAEQRASSLVAGAQNQNSLYAMKESASNAKLNQLLGLGTTIYANMPAKKPPLLGPDMG